MEQVNSILIVDDHPLFREGLKSIIEGDNRFKVVGEAGNGHEAFYMAEDTKPNIVLLDISLPDQNGILLILDLLRLLPEAKILIISIHSKLDYIIKGFKYGAKGYVTKESSSNTIMTAMETVAGGGCFIDSSISKKIVQQLINSIKDDDNITDAKYKHLTPREQEVLKILAEGCTAKQAGIKLKISPKTVENHRANIMQKLDIHTSIELVRYSARIGLIDPEMWKNYNFNDFNNDQ
jgi:DNA-binding NarL/FixJ family response regulator